MNLQINHRDSECGVLCQSDYFQNICSFFNILDICKIIVKISRFHYNFVFGKCRSKQISACIKYDFPNLCDILDIKYTINSDNGSKSRFEIKTIAKILSNFNELVSLIEQSPNCSIYTERLYHDDESNPHQFCLSYLCICGISAVIEFYLPKVESQLQIC